MRWVNNIEYIGTLSKLEIEDLGLSIGCRDFDRRSPIHYLPVVCPKPNVVCAKLKDVCLSGRINEGYKARLVGRKFDLSYVSASRPPCERALNSRKPILTKS